MLAEQITLQHSIEVEESAKPRFTREYILKYAQIVMYPTNRAPRACVQMVNPNIKDISCIFILAAISIIFFVSFIVHKLNIVAFTNFSNHLAHNKNHPFFLINKKRQAANIQERPCLISYICCLSETLFVDYSIVATLSTSWLPRYTILRHGSCWLHVITVLLTDNY